MSKKRILRSPMSMRPFDSKHRKMSQGPLKPHNEAAIITNLTNTSGLTATKVAFGSLRSHTGQISNMMIRRSADKTSTALFRFVAPLGTGVIVEPRNAFVMLHAVGALAATITLISIREQGGPLMRPL
jgi:hypothetical protein